MAETCAVIINPRARDGKVAEQRQALERELARHLGSRFALEFELTRGPMDGARIAREALDGGAALVVAVGGDGTLHEVLNGFFDGDRLVRDVPLALLPRGTGGDTRRTLGLPSDVGDFARMLSAGESRRIDVGIASFTDAAGKPTVHAFINIGDLGVGGDVVARVNAGSKRLGGFLSFLGSTVAALLTYRPKEVEIRFDGGPPQRRALLILAVANCQYFGGGMRIAPQADPFDGQLDVILVEHGGLLHLLVNLPRIYAGTHLEVKGVTSLRARTIEARPVAGDVLLDLDGEQPGRLPVTFRILPRALTFCMPVA